MNKRDYYTILGLDDTATSDDIKQAYRRLASKYHPDKYTDTLEKKSVEVKFKEIKEAYEFLSNPAPQEKFGNFSTGNPFSDEQFADVFSEIFGRGNTSFRHGAKHQAPKQEVFVVTISLQDAYIGCTINANGTAINIPKGVRTGTRLFVDNKIYRVDVQADDRYKRSGDDLLFDISISAVEAILGVSVVFDHLDGVKLQFTIPPGIQAGQAVKLSKKGMKNPETDQIGDMLVRVAVFVPKTLTEEDRAMLKKVTHREEINL